MSFLRFLSFAVFFSVFPFSAYAQSELKSSEYNSWVRIPITDTLRNKLYSADKKDLVETIYDLSVENKLAIFYDSTTLTNETKWSIIPLTILVTNRDSSEIQLVDLRRRAMTLYNSSSEMLKDMYGNPVTIFQDGMEQYVYAPPTEIPAKAINLFEVEVMYSIRKNKRKQTYEYQPVGLGLGIIGKSQTVWIDIKEFKKAFKNWTSFPVFRWIEENNNVSFQYKQKGIVPIPSDAGLVSKRIRIEVKNIENTRLFSPDEGSTGSFVDYVFSLLDTAELKAYTCFENEHWLGRYNYNSAKFYADYLFYDFEKARSRIQMESRNRIFKDTTLLIDGHYVDTVIELEEQKTYFYLNKSQVKALHILETADKVGNKTLKPVGIAFVIDKDDENFELFQINLMDIMEVDPNFKLSEWYSIFYDRKYVGVPYWQIKQGVRLFRN